LKAEDFEIGKSYENYKGVYEVLSIAGDAMRIRWDDTGEEIETTSASQAKIIDYIVRERAESTRKARSGASSQYGKSFVGLRECDFSGSPTGTHWRSREQLGGAVSNLLEQNGLFLQSWSIYRQAIVHWADVTHRSQEPACYQAKLAAFMGPADLRCGFYVERSDKVEDPRGS